MWTRVVRIRSQPRARFASICAMGQSRTTCTDNDLFEDCRPGRPEIKSSVYKAIAEARHMSTSNTIGHAVVDSSQKSPLELIAASDSFLHNNDLSFEQWSRQNFELFSQWRHILFKIPYSDKELLEKSVVCLDSLVHACLDRYYEESKAVNEDQKIQKQMGDNVMQFVSTGIYAWGRMAPHFHAAPIKAEALREKLNQSVDPSFFQKQAAFRKPDLFIALTYCWSCSRSRPEAPHKAHQWLNRIINHPKQLSQKDLVHTYNAVLRAYARRGNVRQVKLLIDSMPVKGNAYTYESIIQSWVHSNLPEAPHEAYSALQRGIQQGLWGDDILPVTQIFGRFLNMNRKKPEVCDLILNQLYRLQQRYPSMQLLQARHLIIVMTAWARKGQPSKAMELLQVMQKLYDNGDERFRPSYQVMVVVLSAFTKHRTYESLKEAEALLDRIENVYIHQLSDSVSNHAYNLLLDAYSRTSSELEQEKKSNLIRIMMTRMKQLSHTYNNPALLPDKVSYTCLLRAIVDESGPGFVNEILGIINDMEESDQPSLKPDLNVYAMAFEAFYKNGQDVTNGQYATDLLDRIKESYSQGTSMLRPDEIIYTILIKIYSNCGDPEKSESALEMMIEDYKDGNLSCRPSELAFTTAMISWGRSGREDAVDHAMRLFNYMKQHYEVEENPDCRPSIITFRQLMAILSRSKKNENKLNRGQSILKSMKDYGVGLDLQVCNNFLHVCATSTTRFSNQSECFDAFQAALKMFEWLRSKDSPHLRADSSSYSSMLFACENLIVDTKERNDHLCQIFDKCTQDGLVNRKMLLMLRRYLDAKTFRSLTSLDPKADLKLEDIPYEWRQNTKDK